MKDSRSPHKNIIQIAPLGWITSWLTQDLNMQFEKQGYLGKLDANINMSDHTMSYIDFDEMALFWGLINRPTDPRERNLDKS